MASIKNTDAMDVTVHNGDRQDASKRHRGNSRDSDDDDLPAPMPHFRLEKRKSYIDEAIAEHALAAEVSISKLYDPEEHGDLSRPDELTGCVFVGHTATDMDSIGSAVAGAELFHGHAASASDLNSETKFALDYWKVAPPPPFLEVLNRVGINAPICLVDHNQVTQMTAGIEPKNIKGVIDHHAIQSQSIVTDLPIYVNIRPWGSACTIITHMFISQNRAMKRQTAGLLLSGILSDTLNLCSPTTTNTDRLMVTILARLADVRDVNSYALQMFRAKSKDLLTVSAHMLVRGDYKKFKFVVVDREINIAFSVVETIDPEGVLNRRKDLLLELRALKKEEKMDYAFLAVVDILKLHSTLLCCGSGERALGERVFGGHTTPDNLLDLGRRVSRKKDYIPGISAVISAGFQHVASPGLHPMDPDEDFGEVFVDCTANGCILTRKPTLMRTASVNAECTCPPAQ